MVAVLIACIISTMFLRQGKYNQQSKIVDYNTDTMCVEVTGEPGKIDAFIEVMKPLGIEEICRTGVVAMERGNNILS